MQAYPNYLESQRQNEIRKIAEAQNRLAYLEQQQQMQNGNMQYFWQNNNQMQQPQQSMGLNGKIVDDFDVITGNDVPMDGIGAIFLKNDGSEIQRRVWNATNGSIITTSYIPMQLENITNDANNKPKMDFNSLNEDVRALREDIKGVRDMIEKSMNVPTPKATIRTKKGADEE